jgi:AraC-like DNA-binding protein
MIYIEQTSCNDLKDIIQNYWKFEVLDKPDLKFPINHETLPESTVSLVFINQPYYSGIRLMGPHSKKYTQSLFPDSIFVGIRFQPWITIKSLTNKKSDVLNKTTDTSILIQDQFKEIHIKVGFNNFKLLDKQILKFLNTIEIEKNDLVKYICLELNLGKPISEVTSQIPVSTRVIQKKFKEFTGVTMKQYANIERQRNTWKAIILENKNQMDAILDNGFFDQSHFINEFKKIMKRSHSDFQSYLSSVEMTFH